MTEIRITFFKGPASNVKPCITSRIEWDSFAERLSSPKQGAKDGSYYVRGVCKGDRKNENMLSAWLGVVDADHGAGGGPCPPFDAAVDALERIDLEYCCYTSFSHLPEKPRYRILFPLSQSLKTAAAVATLYRALLNMLVDEGIRLRPTQESGTFSQPWYPPRYQTDTQLKNFRFGQGGIKTLNPAEVIPKAPKASNGQIIKPKVNVRECIEAIRSGADVHNSMNSIIAHMIVRGIDQDTITVLTKQIVQNNAPTEKVKARLKEIPRSIEGAVKKYAKTRGESYERGNFKLYY